MDTKFHPEGIAPGVFIAENAVVRGRVIVGAKSSIWFGAVVRGDTAEVVLGEATNVQDLCVLHADPGFPCRIGNRVTIGHAAIVHGAAVDDDVLIGMRAVVMNGAKIGARTIIGAGALIPEGATIAPDSVVLGAPGRVIRAVTDEDLKRIHHAADHYVTAAQAYQQNLPSPSLRSDQPPP